MPEFTDEDRKILLNLDRTVNNGLINDVAETKEMTRDNNQSIHRIEKEMLKMAENINIFIQTRELTCPFRARAKSRTRSFLQNWLGPIVTGVIVGGALLVLGG